MKFEMLKNQPNFYQQLMNNFEQYEFNLKHSYQALRVAKNKARHVANKFKQKLMSSDSKFKNAQSSPGKSQYTHKSIKMSSDNNSPKHLPSSSPSQNFKIQLPAFPVKISQLGSENAADDK